MVKQGGHFSWCKNGAKKVDSGADMWYTKVPYE